MSFFDRQAIPEALLQERGSSQAEAEEEGSTVDGKASKGSGGDTGTSASSESNAEPTVDKVEEYEKDIVVLRNYNLISCTTDGTTFEMHRLVQLATKKWLKTVMQFDRWSSQCISNLEEAFPNSDFDNWATCQSLFPHSMVALHMEVTDPATVLQQSSLLHRSGRYASAAGAYADAEKMAERSLEARRNVLGGRHPDTLTSMDNLAMTYSKQGRLVEAEKVQEEVVEKRKAVLGAGHPDTLASISNLAVTYWQQGRLDEAEKLEVEVMEKMKEVLGAGHPDTLASMGNLAFTLRALGRRQSALNLISSCAEISQATLGMKHPDTMAAFFHRAQWEANDLMDVTSNGTSEERQEERGAEEEAVAMTALVEDPKGSGLDPTENCNTWNERQYLWFL
jgi:tetratricopeptide (TPR) repeat protein